MKKILVLIVLLCCVGGSFAFSWSKKDEVAKPEIKIVDGQIWKKNFTGNTHKVMEVGEKYIVYKFAKGSYAGIDVKSREEFRAEFKLIKDVPKAEVPRLTYSATTKSLILTDVTGYGDVVPGFGGKTFRDQKDPSDCTHNGLIAKDKKDYWVLRTNNGKYGILWHRVYVCQGCKSDIIVAQATRNLKEK